MNIVVNEEDFISLQNAKIQEQHKNRINSKSKDVRVEARVEKLEVQINDITTEIKMLNKTMQDVALTLREIKEDQKKIQTFEIQKAMLERDILDVKNLVGVVFKKVDGLTESIQSIKESNAGNNIKINNNERVFWLLVTGAIGALGWFNK